ncbi:MAG: porin, partial [Firmicutes bacterium]|nr:porin [Bacillota bacterium]
FNPSWGADLWITNGEDKNGDNNQGKTLGGNVSYNHQGAQDKFVNLSFFTGPEQDAFSSTAVPGSEGRKRDRVSHGGQWIWDHWTLAWEGELLRETFPSAWVQGASGNTIRGTLTAFGTWLKVQVTPVYSGYLRLEQIYDDLGFRVNWDNAIATGHAMRVNADLRLQAASLGIERRMGPAFVRAEVRHDRINRDLVDRDGHVFRQVTSATLAVGASFGQ